MSKRYEVVLPDGLAAELGWPDSEVPARVREALVMDLLRLDRLSEAQAAEILGLDRWSLLDAMSRHEVPAVTLSSDELDAELNQELKRGA